MSYTCNSDVHGGLDNLAMAYKNISEGFCDAAIVGAVSSILDPHSSLEYVKIEEVLSPDGITRPFDKSGR